jgi:hypothetical protein
MNLFTAKNARSIVRIGSMGVKTTRKFTAVSLAALAIAFAAPAAFAQGPIWVVDGELVDGDAQAPAEEGAEQGAERHRYDDHRIQLEAGRRYSLSVNSDAFDPIARLLRPGSPDVIAENDDSGETLNSRIAYTPAESGDYILRVTGFAADARGAYHAEAAQLPPLPAPVAQPTQNVPVTGTWALFQGELAATDPEIDGKHYDDYLIHVGAGQVRYISLEGQGFDALVQVLRASEREGGETLEQDDDTGAGLNSLLAFAPDEAGDYIVRVTTFGENSTGSYRLWVSQ